jgi:hypothetical protein
MFIVFGKPPSQANAPYWFVPTLRLYHHPIQLVDIFRYVLLSRVGGMYADLDNECKSTPDFAELSNKCEVLLAETCCNSSNMDQDGRMRDSLARWEHLTGVCVCVRARVCVHVGGAVGSAPLFG